MGRPGDRLVRGLVAAAVGCILIAVAVTITGGGAFRLGGILLRSHDPVRPMIGAVVLSVLALALGPSTVAAALEWHWRLLERYATGAAVVLSIAAVAAGFRWGAFIAGGSDSYCYLNQAELLARGVVHDREPLSEDATWPGNAWSFAPAGHMPLGTRNPALAPICPAGYPLIMAGARRTIGRQAMFWITPVMGAVAVFAAFLLGRALAGPAAGLLTATLTLASPTFLMQLFQPMNDVTAAALWGAAIVVAVRDGRRDLPRAALSGLFTAAALTVRPNLVPLAATVGLGLALIPTPRSLVQRLSILLVFGLATLPGVAVVMTMQNAMYGSPLRSGYGDLDTMFSVSHLIPNLKRYPRWLIDVHTPALAAALAAPWLLTARGTRRRAFWLLAFAGVALACYLP